MRLIHYDEVPVGLLKLRLGIFIPTELIEAADGQIGLGEGVATAGSLKAVVRDNLEGQMEAAVQFVLPLLNETARANDQAAVQVATDQQLFDEEPGHDGLTGTGGVGEEEAQRLAREHLPPNRGELWRQRAN